jgi:integrase
MKPVPRSVNLALAGLFKHPLSSALKPGELTQKDQGHIAGRAVLQLCRAREAIDQWLLASDLGSKPVAALFPAFGKDKKTIELRHTDRTSVWKLVQTRARACGLQKRVCCHSFRATGITEYMSAGGALGIAQRIAGHSQLSITKLYDRSQDRVTIAEIERVSFELSWEPNCGGKAPAPP